MEGSHWRGVVDTTLADHERRLLALERATEAIQELAVQLARTEQRVAWIAGTAAGIASLSAGILTALVVRGLG